MLPTGVFGAAAGPPQLWRVWSDHQVLSVPEATTMPASNGKRGRAYLPGHRADGEIPAGCGPGRHRHHGPDQIRRTGARRPLANRARSGPATWSVAQHGPRGDPRVEDA